METFTRTLGFQIFTHERIKNENRKETHQMFTHAFLPQKYTPVTPLLTIYVLQFHTVSDKQIAYT